MGLEINSAQVKYSCWGAFTCTLKAEEVVKGFKGEFKGWLKITEKTSVKPDPRVKDKSIDPESFPEEKGIVLMNQALVLLGLIKPDDLKVLGMKRWSIWGNATVKGLKKFQEIAKIPPGQKRSGGELEDAPGKVFGWQTAKTMIHALQILQKGGNWKTAVKSFDPDNKMT